MPALHVLLGALLLFFGRRLYWLFVAVAGFLVGAQLAEVALADQSPAVRLLTAIAAGALGALLAMLAQRIGFALGGMYAGGYLALNLATTTGNGDNHLAWAIAGGLVGAVLAFLLIDWAVIVLSSLVGAGAIVAALGLSLTLSAVVFVLLAVLGIGVQGRQLRPPVDRRAPPT